VSERLHFMSTLLVALGTTLSAFWILCLNSWMQTPVGYEVRDGVFHATSWLAILTNPSFPLRLAHMLIASLLTVCFLMAGVSAWQLLRGTPNASTARVLRVGVSVAAVLVPVQVLVGDLHGLNTLEHQPQKVAAMEGIWRTERGAPLLLFAWPDEEARTNRYAVGIPRAGSLILTHDLDGKIKGLNDFPDAHPPVAPVFYGFRIMVGIGLLMLATSWTAWWTGRRRGWDAAALPRGLLWTLAAMTFSGWVAVLAGWFVTEIGRQPYIVFGLVRTAEVAADVPSGMIASTLAMYIVLYVVLVLAYVAVIRYLAEKTEHEEPTPAELHSSAAVASTVEHAT
jgi:cytochrome bd ubiquinol oxidase subunit I